MSNLCDRLVELLGEPLLNQNPETAAVFLEFAEKPIVDYGSPNERLWTFYFPESGFHLIFDSNHDCFIHLTFSLIVDKVDGNCEDQLLGPDEPFGDSMPDGAYLELSYKPYCGSLPLGLERGYARDLVETKFPGSTSIGEYFQFGTDLKSLKLFVGIDQNEGLIKFVTVFYEF